MECNQAEMRRIKIEELHQWSKEKYTIASDPLKFLRPLTKLLTKLLCLQLKLPDEDICTAVDKDRGNRISGTGNSSQNN